MPEAIMAHPDLRHPFEHQPIDPSSGATVLYGGRTISIERASDDGGLWVSPAELTQINGFELKPEGACFESLCIPLQTHAGILKESNSLQFINLVAFAELLGQQVVADETTHTYCFGEIPAKRDSMMNDAQAPEFEVVDRQGNVVRMSDYKGKKALIITWSSW